MISPYVRRLRLGQELRTLRTAADITHTQMAAKVSFSRQQISRLELGQAAPDLNDVMEILDVLGIGVDDGRWSQVMEIARQAAEKGWWSKHKGMGKRQALFADLEAGATSIREYQQALIPGLLQTEEFTRSRLDSNPWPLAEGMTVSGVVSGRATRQRMLHRADGPTYEVIVDELAIRRAAVPPDVLSSQLRALARSSSGNDRISVLVLPVNAQIGGYRVPTGSFSIYAYADPGDPVVVGIESITDDVVLTDPAQAERYVVMYNALRSAALSVADSHELLVQAADQLPRG